MKCLPGVPFGLDASNARPKGEHDSNTQPISVRVRGDSQGLERRLCASPSRIQLFCHRQRPTRTTKAISAKAAIDQINNSISDLGRLRCLSSVVIVVLGDRGSRCRGCRCSLLKHSHIEAPVRLTSLLIYISKFEVAACAHDTHFIHRVPRSPLCMFRGNKVQKER